MLCAHKPMRFNHSGLRELSQLLLGFQLDKVSTCCEVSKG